MGENVTPVASDVTVQCVPAGSHLPEIPDHTSSPLHHLKGIACVLFAVLIWSGWVVMSRFGVKGVLSPYDITAIRFTTAGLLLLPMAWKRGLKIGPWGLKGGLLLSVLLGACYANIVIFGMKFAPVSHASTINTGTFLTLITLLGIHGLREHVPRLRLAGVACSLIGISLMLSVKGSDYSSSQWIGHLCFMTGATMWAGYVILTRTWKVDAIHATVVVCVFSMLTYTPLYLLFADGHIFSCPPQELALQIVYQGVLTSIVALFAFNVGVGILGAARAGAFVPLIPAFSTLLAFYFLDEVPSFVEVMGICTVSIGVFLATGAAGMLRGRKL